jgi:predicted dehydrogenase
MRKVRLGVVGCGDVALRSYLPPLSNFADKAELVATCDTVPARARKAQEQFGARRAYQKLDDLLADGEVDAVINLTPVRWHYAVGLRCLQRGKHLYQEKPLASAMAEADSLISEAERRALTLVCAPATNMLPSRRYGRQLLRDGSIGRIVLAIAHASTGGPARWLDYTSDPTWFYQEGAGPLVDTGVYAIDYLVDTLGPAKRVMGLAGIAVPQVISQAEGAKEKPISVTAPDNTALLIDFGEATFGVIESSFCVVAQHGPPVEFHGERGSLAVHHWWDDPALEIFRDGSDCWEPVMLPAEFAALPDFGWAVGVLQLVDCLLTGEPPVLSGARARHVLEIMLAAYDSSRDGRAVEIKTSL